MRDSCFSLGSHGTVPRFPLGQIALMHGAGGSGSGSWQLLGGRAPLVPFPLHQACWYSPVGLMWPHPAGRMERVPSCSGFIMALHTALSRRLAHSVGARTCRHPRDKPRTTETLKHVSGQMLYVGARPLCCWFWSLWLLLARIKCK